MSLFNRDNSFEKTNDFYTKQDRATLLKIPLQRELYVPMYKESVNLIIGIMPNYKSEIKEIDYPSGHSQQINVVTHWKIVPKDKLYIYNSGAKNVKEEDFIITVPYHYIDIDNVEILRQAHEK